MNRLACISELKEGAAMSALDTAIEAIRDHMDRWGSTMEPEERTYTRTILGTLIDLQVVSVTEAVRMGCVMADRLAATHAELDRWEAETAERGLAA